MKRATRDRMASAEKLSYRTPPSFLELVYRIGPIALDPCAHPHGKVKADRLIFPRPGWQLRPGEQGQGLEADWYELSHRRRGRSIVFVNPPYGRHIIPWANKIALEAERGTEILVLVGARVDTAWFQTMADPRLEPIVLFWKGRIVFVGARNGAFFPSAVFYFGRRRSRFARAFRKRGTFVLPTNCRPGRLQIAA